MISKSFILGGKAIFTIEPSPEFVALHAKAEPLDDGRILPSCRSHYTYKIEKVEDNPEICFAYALKGRDNENDYFYLGVVRIDGGELFAGKEREIMNEVHNFRILRRVLLAIWQGRENEIEAAGWKVNHAGKCCRCGRKLTTPESIESGIGPECRKFITCGGLDKQAVEAAVK